MIEDEDIERQVDALFEAADKAAFFILDQIVEMVRETHLQQHEPEQHGPTPQ